MPFKLKLKKTRQYNVASKNLFVISVELLDGGIADCTLSVDSTGQECLDNVCQRQAINQAEFFGLRYINRSHQPRWVQLERPLKRQLDKYASSHQLYLRLMYYITSGTSLITDEVTRYHYFLQLKNDLIEGRIICDCQQAVVLASYSRQAEYGNHDQERHTVEYLKNLLTFPKQMIDGDGQLIDGTTLAETGRLEWLTATVIQHHLSLHNMSQAQAEEGFITACQQLRGYGQEMFLAREQSTQAEVTIAVSITGIMVLNETTDNPRFYRWMDITNVINHKRTFSIECAKPSNSAWFQLPTPEDGKYVWRVCVQQHTFYMRHQPVKGSTPAPHVNMHIQEHGLSESREQLESVGADPGRLQRAHSTSCLELQRARQPPANANSASRQLLPQYRPAPDYETAIQQKYQQQRAEAQIRFQNHHPHNQLVTNKPMAYGSHPDIHRVHYPDVTRHTINQTDDYNFGLKYLGHNYTPFAVNPNVQTELNPQLHYVNVYKPPPPYPSIGLASNSTPDLAVASQAMSYPRGYITSHVSGSSPDLVSTRSALNRQYLGYINGNVLMNYQRNVLPSTHGTYSDLNAVMDVASTHRHIQKVHDERGNIMYSMPMREVQYQRHVLPQTTKRNEQEPIYENVPMQWREHNSLIRDRAHSLTTTDEIHRLNERNASHPTINKYMQPKTVPNYPQVPSIKVDSPDSHYVNAQIIKVARESSVPKESISTSNRSINITTNNNNDGFENVVLSMEKVSINSKDYDETPYQSLSTHKMNNNTVLEKHDSSNITSISVPDIRHSAFNSNSSVTDSALASSIMNSTYSTTDLEISSNTTKSSVASKDKEKKRRRWGVFIGKSKDSDVKSATLGRDAAKVKNAAANKNRWSTGLPKFQPLPPSITKETLCQLLERKMSEDQLSFAFEQIPKGRTANCEMTTALLPQYSYLNGHSTDFLPYEDNRVKLHSSVNNPHAYINASHITFTVGSKQQFYVLVNLPCQRAGGLLDPAALFWELCWLLDARVIVTSRLNYLLPMDKQNALFGEITVRVESFTAASWGGTRRVSLNGGRHRGEKLVWLLQYTAWEPPLAAPPTESLSQCLDLISEINSLMSLSMASSNGQSLATPPLVCACAPDLADKLPVHRAPLILTAHLLLHILDHNQELDIPRTVGLLHQQRANMIQNVHQYRFLHQVLLHYLKQSRLI